MKKILFSIAMLMALNCATLSAEVKREGKTFVEVQGSDKSAASAKKTEYTYKDKDGKTYPIMVSSNGRAYIIKVSKNGNEYKKYLGEDISRDICKELGIEYKDMKRN